MRGLCSRLMILVVSGQHVMLATASTSSSGCTSVTVSGAGLSSGTYRGLSSTSYYMAAGMDYHELYYSSGAWYIEPYVASYPMYRTYDEVTDPTAITLDWAECDATSCDWDVAASITITCADTSGTSSSVSTTTVCTSVTITDFGIYTGTYREIEATTYDELYYRAGGTDFYYLYRDDEAWYLYPNVASYPQYRTFDDAAHPVDLSLGWAECGAQFCDWDEPSPSPIPITCADTTDDEPEASTCTSVTVLDFGEFTGTYRKVAASSYDQHYYRAAGIDYYYIYLSDGTWTILGGVTTYPRYRTFDDATHPVDISLEWAECGALFCDWDQPSPSPLNMTCADTSSSSDSDAAASTCSSVTISDWDDFSGTYVETASTSWDKYFFRSGGTDTYSLYVDDGAWYLKPDDAGYPRYRTFDDATHPADITLDWVECGTMYCDWDVPTASPVPIACEGSSSDPTSTSDGDAAAITDESTSDSALISESAGGDVLTTADDPTAEPTATPGSDAATTIDDAGPDTPTPEPVNSSSRDVDAPSSGSITNPPATNPSATSPPAVAETIDDGEVDSGDSLSAGVIAAISVVALALVGGGLGVAFKHNSIHCCSRQHISNSSVA